MKATLTYEFNLPEDKWDFSAITNAEKYKLAISSFSEKLRGFRKYDDSLDSRTLETVLAAWREETSDLPGDD